MLRANLASISALFDAYATVAPQGVLTSCRCLHGCRCSRRKLFDSDFTPREAVLAFSATTRVVDEIKSRTKVLHLSLTDLSMPYSGSAYEKLRRPISCAAAGSARGEHYLELIQAQSSVYENFLRPPRSDLKQSVGMPSHRGASSAPIVVAVVRGSAPESTALTPDEVAAFIERS